MENTCNDLSRVIPINIDLLACKFKSFNYLGFVFVLFLLYIAFSLTQHLVVESLMLPGAPQTTSCKFLQGKPAFVCGSIPGFLNIYLETKQKATVICVFL